MKLYLVQHGEAVAKEVNPQRPLSEPGRADVQRLAALLARTGCRPTRLLHSGKTRAEQTALILAAKVLPEGRPQAAQGLSPNDPIEATADRVDQWTDDTMVVGHLPHLAKLVAHLLTGNQASCSVAFTPGTALGLERTEDRRWSLVWMITPALTSPSPQD